MPQGFIPFPFDGDGGILLEKLSAGHSTSQKLQFEN